LAECRHPKQAAPDLPACPPRPGLALTHDKTPGDNAIWTRIIPVRFVRKIPEDI